MTRWILDSPNPDIHEPGFGLGAFFRAAPKMPEPDTPAAK